MLRAKTRFGAVATAILVAALLVPVAATPVNASGSPAQSPAPIYLDPHYSFAERAADLVSRMTLEEKVEQLSTNNAPPIPRLGVQQYTYWNEGQHGVNTLGANANDGATHVGGVRLPIATATSFPTNFAAGMSWDPEMMYRETTAVSDEARGFVDKSLWGTGQNNLSSPTSYGSLTYWAPTVNMDRDPRWGRADETFGEDPYAVQQMTGAYVNGYQGQTLDGKSLTGYLKVAATAKHFALNNIDSGRLENSSNTDDANLRDYYTAQFRSLIEDAHVSGLMTGLNAINGTPATTDTYTVNELAQRTYGFTGYITSDCIGIRAIYRSAPSGHDWAPPGWTTDHQGDNATWTNTATGQQVSGKAGAEAYALRAGTALNCLGYENRLKYVQEAIKAGVLSEGVVDTALVHLFTVRMQTGEFDPPGKVPYTKITKDVIESPAHQALAQQVAANDIVLLKNDSLSDGHPLLPVNAAALGRVVIVGALANSVTLGGYSGHPSLQVNAVQGITAAVHAADPNASVTYDGCGTSTTATAPAQCSAQTQADMKTADLVVVFAGTDAQVASEGSDRTSLAMPGNYGSLISQVHQAGNPRTALVIQSDGPVKIDDIQNDFPAIVFSGYNGESQGSALASVLTGAQNPSGHLDFTWYRDDSQLPPITNYGLTPSQTAGLGRTYMYFTGTPSYPFGYGLSYSHFAYSHVEVGPKSVTANGDVHVSFDVANTGSSPGATVAQLYAAAGFAVPGVQLPKKQLVRFQKTRTLRPGEHQHISLNVHVPDLSRWDESRLKQVVYDGPYQFQVSADAAAVMGSGTVQVSGAITPHVQSVTVQPGQVVFHAGETLNLTGQNPWIADDTDPSMEQPHATADHIVEAVNNDQSFVDLRHADVRYASSNPDVATVAASGKVTMTGAGTATITASVNGVSGSAVIVVDQLALTAPPTMAPGDTATVTTSLPNPSSHSLRDATITLTTPSGWTATPASPATFATIPAGGTAVTTWTIAVPADAKPGGYHLTALATYEGPRGQVSAPAVAQSSLPYPAVQPPYRTFAAPADGPAAFSQQGDEFGITTDGWNVWTGNDEYGATYLPAGATSDTTAVVRVDHQDDTNPWSKAGIMMRTDITRAAASTGYAIIAVTPENGVTFEWDGTGNGRLDQDVNTGARSATTPIWLKLTRNGATFAGYYSTDAVNWTKVASADVPGTSSNEDVGMFTTSNDPLVAGRADFSDFQVTPTSSG